MPADQPAAPQASTDELIQRCAEGDQRAWEAIVAQHRRRVFNVAYRFTGTHEEAEDLTQEIFLKVFRSLHTFDRRANFQTWLISVSRNLCIDHYRSMRKEREAIFQSYFHAFPWTRLPQGGGIGMDIGCGSGRWSVMVAPRVAHLHLLEISPDALVVAQENLLSAKNVSFHLASVNNIPLPPVSLDFAFSLGVLHHVPDTQSAIDHIASKLKPGAPFLVYLYYAFDDRAPWYRVLWKASDWLRSIISRLPPHLRLLLSQLIAVFVYWPLARVAGVVEWLGYSPHSMPLAWYRAKSLYVMRTDAYDRFCTKLEKRFTRGQVEEMLTRAGFRDIVFSETEPYWCAVGIKNG